MNVKSAFLNAYLNEEVFVEQPKRFIDPTCPQHVYKLQKALYGLKQALEVFPFMLSLDFLTYVNGYVSILGVYISVYLCGLG